MNSVPANRFPSALIAVAALLACLSASGCHVLTPQATPVVSQQIAPELMDDQSQIEVGQSNRVIDSIGWVIGIPDKLLLWDRRVEQHRISEDTLLNLADYLEYNNLPHVKVRANQYAPLDDWKRLTLNKTVAWPWRYSIGALAVAGETVFPGRIFGGDHYNPFTQTIHLYSDVPSIALHEGAHAKDFTRRELQGTYAAAYLFVPIWHEGIATRDVFAYLDNFGSDEQVVEANRILYPAYATYVGQAIGSFAPAYSTPIYYASVLAGHVNGRLISRPLRERIAARQAADPMPIAQQNSPRLPSVEPVVARQVSHTEPVASAQLHLPTRVPAKR